MAGTLFIVSTPIGDPEDVTLRALRVLQECAVIVAEHPAVTRALLARYAITTPIASYALDGATDEVLLARLQSGESVALVCDAGTPVLCDPGARLVSVAHDRGVRTRPVPGPSALSAAVAVSGCGERFQFLGLLASRAVARRAQLRALAHVPQAAILFADGRRLRTLLRELDRLVPRRRIVLVMDATTGRERVERGTARQLVQVRGIGRAKEVTVVVDAEDARSRSGRGRIRRRPSG